MGNLCSVTTGDIVTESHDVKRRIFTKSLRHVFRHQACMTSYNQNTVLNHSEYRNSNNEESYINSIYFIVSNAANHVLACER